MDMSSVRGEGLVIGRASNTLSISIELTRTVGLINHWLNDTTSGIDEPGER